MKTIGAVIDVPSSRRETAANQRHGRDRRHGPGHAAQPTSAPADPSISFSAWTTGPHRVVIVGGGFGGLQAALKLGGTRSR